MTPISAPSAPLPHHKSLGAETTANPLRRTTPLGGAGVRCGECGAAGNATTAPRNFRTTTKTMNEGRNDLKNTPNRRGPNMSIQTPIARTAMALKARQESQERIAS